MRGRLILIASIAMIVGASIGSVTSTSAAPPSPSPTQTVGYLQVSGLKGDSVRRDFTGAVEIRSFVFSAAKSGAKAPVYKRLSVAAAIDSASVGLLERLSLGTSISTVKLSLTRETGNGPVVFKTFTLSNAKIPALREFASGQGADVPMIEIGFAYKRMAVEYARVNPDGSPAAPLGFCWNLANASKC